MVPEHDGRYAGRLPTASLRLAYPPFVRDRVDGHIEAFDDDELAVTFLEIVEEDLHAGTERTAFRAEI